MAENLGAASVKFNVLQPTTRGERLHETGESLSVTEIIQLGRYVEGKLGLTTPVRLVFDFPHAFRSLKRISSGDGCGECGILGILGVTAAGKYALCGIGDVVEDLVFGRVGQDGLEDLWKSHPVLEELRTGLPDRLGGICSRCLMKRRCLGSCVAQNYYREGTPVCAVLVLPAGGGCGAFPAIPPDNEAG